MDRHPTRATTYTRTRTQQRNGRALLRTIHTKFYVDGPPFHPPRAQTHTATKLPRTAHLTCPFALADQIFADVTLTAGPGTTTGAHGAGRRQRGPWVGRTDDDWDDGRRATADLPRAHRAGKESGAPLPRALEGRATGGLSR